MSRRVLAQGLILVGVATLVGNGSAYLLSMVAARVLSPADFGAFGALTGLLIIVATLTIAMQTVTARRVAVAGGARSRVEHQALRVGVLVGAAILIGGCLAAWPLGELLTIPPLAVLMGVSSVAFVVVGCTAQGIAQGRQAHGRLSWTFMINGVARAAVGIICVVWAGTVTGAAAGIMVGTACGSVLSFLLIRRPPNDAPADDAPPTPMSWRSIWATWSAEFGHSTHALIVLYTLTNVDVLLARLFLSEESSGEYSVGVLLAKIAFFLPYAIVIVLFPRMSAQGSKRTVFLAAGLTAAVGIAITIVSAVAGSVVAGILGGVQYPDLGGQMWLFALEGSAFALVQVLLYARLAAQDRRAVAAVWGALVVLVAVVAIWRHDSVTQIVTSVVVVSLLLTVGGLVLDLVRGKSRTAVPDGPLEPAQLPE